MALTNAKLAWTQEWPRNKKDALFWVFRELSGNPNPKKENKGPTPVPSSYRPEVGDDLGGELPSALVEIFVLLEEGVM